MTLLRLQIAFVLLAASFAAAQGTPAREAAPDAPVTTLKLSTSLVPIYATVRDRSGAPVHGLKQSDFKLKVDGQEQQPRYFVESSDLPLNLALLVDVSGSQRTLIAPETEASAVFFPLMLTRAQDQATLIEFDNNVLQLEKMTPQIGKLENALRLLTANGARIPEHHATGTLLYDAVISAARFSFADAPGRRAMVILTDGEDDGSRFTLPDAIEEAGRANVIVYSVLYSAREEFGFGGGGRHGGPSGSEVLRKLAAATGGRMFVVTPKLPLDQIYTQIADELRQQYRLDLVPGEEKPGSRHAIQLKVVDKHESVQARTEYYTPR